MPRRACVAPRARFVTGDHSPLHVEVLGKEPGPGVETFMLIHGFGGSMYSWRHWTPSLASRGRVLLVDMKGFGAAAKPNDGRYSPTDQAELIKRLIDSEDPDHLTLVGHSLGGGVALLVALSMADRSDSRLRRMVIVAGAAYAQRLPPFVTLAYYPRLTRTALRLIGPERAIRYVLRSIVHDPATVEPSQVRAYAKALQTSEGVRAMLAAARQIVPARLSQLTARYAELDVPTLLLWGRGDRVVPVSIGERLCKELPQAQLEVLDECGHIPHEERPTASLETLEAFLNGP